MMALLIFSLLSVPVDLDSDGLDDALEAGGYREGLSLSALGCKPGRPDLILVTLRHPDVAASTLDEWIVDTKAVYARIPTRNADGSTGINLIHIPGTDIRRSDAGKEDGELQSYRERRYNGIAHYMVVKADGGGNSDFGDWGVAAGSGNTIAHELGHQIGRMFHAPDDSEFITPFYLSVMNYNFKDRRGITFSSGQRQAISFNEEAMNESMSVPFDELSYLQEDPYRFNVTRVDDRTSQIDWNRNGRIDSSPVRADVNCGSEGWLTERCVKGTWDDLGLATTAPAMCSNGSTLILVHGMGRRGATSAASPGSPTRLGLQIRSGGRWKGPVALPDHRVTGDPSVAYFGGLLHVLAPVESGFVYFTGRVDGRNGSFEGKEGGMLIQSDANQAILYSEGGKEPGLYICTWKRSDGRVRIRQILSASSLGPEKEVTQHMDGRPAQPVTSSKGIAMCFDRYVQAPILTTVASNGSISIWKLYAGSSTKRAQAFDVFQTRLVGGRSGGTRSGSEVRVADDRGKTYLYYRGADGPNLYGSESVEDRSFRGGWLEKMLYNEWTLTSGAVACCPYQEDIAVAFRSAASDDMDRIRVSYRGSGIQPGVHVGDVDDVAAILRSGLRDSLRR